MSHSTDHSSEDLRPLKLTLEALNQERILQLNKTFYLRDISECVCVCVCVCVSAMNSPWRSKQVCCLLHAGTQ